MNVLTEDSVMGSVCCIITGNSRFCHTGKKPGNKAASSTISSLCPG